MASSSVPHPQRWSHYRRSRLPRAMPRKKRAILGCDLWEEKTKGGKRERLQRKRRTLACGCVPRCTETPWLPWSSSSLQGTHHPPRVLMASVTRDSHQTQRASPPRLWAPERGGPAALGCGARAPACLPLHPGHPVQLHVVAAPEPFGEGVVLDLQLRDLKEGGKTGRVTRYCPPDDLGDQGQGNAASGNPRKPVQPVASPGTHHLTREWRL